MEWLKKNGPSGIISAFPNRSCWNCNGAHEFLKKVDYPFDCFECGNIYFKGIKITEPENKNEQKQKNISILGR
jgi:hypothetical protein